MKLAAAITTAITAWHRGTVAGATREEREYALEETLRDVWPYEREWHYLCSACRDTGLVDQVCEPGSRCNGRSTTGQTRFCAEHPAYTHTYGTPCACALGARFRPRATPAAAPRTRPGRP